MAEYGWKPDRVLWLKKTYRGPHIDWYLRERQKRTVSSNSRCQAVEY